MEIKLTTAQQKLLKHRNAAMRKGASAAEYAQKIGVSFQRIGRLLKPGAKIPTLPEACAIEEAAKIRPRLWLQN